MANTWAWTAAAILGFTVGGWNLWHSATALHATTATVKTAPAARELLMKPIEACGGFMIGPPTAIRCGIDWPTMALNSSVHIGKAVGNAIPPKTAA